MSTREARPPAAIGELRRWDNPADEEFGLLFLVTHSEHGRTVILQDGFPREWHERTVRLWSEVVDG